LFALAAVVTKSSDFALPHASGFLLIVALILFLLLAAVGGIVSNWPLRYSQIKIEDLSKFVEATHWVAPPEIAARRVAEAQVHILDRARKLNALHHGELGQIESCIFANL
jgi:hypothetical protein